MLTASLIAKTEGFLREAFHLLSYTPHQVRRDEIQDVVVILGSSRSGSSLLFHLLTESGSFVHPQGEETPFYRMCGLGFCDSVDQDDRIKNYSSKQIEMAASRLLHDCGIGKAPPDKRYLAQAISRVLIQWPERSWLIRDLVTSAVEILDGTDESWRRWLIRNEINSDAYDRFKSDSSIPRGGWIEEPPFIIQTPRGHPVSTAPLLLKTSTNVYRQEWIRALFPNARFHYVLLTRNPAASINGLIDGWMSPAFHSHFVGRFAPLNIEGYSDQNWWKFDLPPGWIHYIDRSLEEVCVFQWLSAYENALQTSASFYRLRFEDIQNKGFEALLPLFEFCGVCPLRIPNPGRVVMASRPPRPGRWKDRGSRMRSLLKNKKLREMANELGYSLELIEEWI